MLSNVFSGSKKKTLRLKTPAHADKCVMKIPHPITQADCHLILFKSHFQYKVTYVCNLIDRQNKQIVCFPIAFQSFWQAKTSRGKAV